MSLTLPIVIGKRYVRRDGQVVTAKKNEPGLGTHTAFVHASGDTIYAAHVFMNTGRSSSNNGIRKAQDLVADYIEPAAHPHAALMLQYAQDAAETAEPWLRWECKPSGCDSWRPLRHPGWITSCEYRRKPRTIRIGEFDVPEPWRQPLDQGADYWLVDLVQGTAGVMECSNFTPSTALTHVALGLVHLTREAAEQHARALLSFTEQK